MLVCSANWLLPDGSLSCSPTASDVAAFVRALATLAGRAGFRRDGRYRPVDRVDLVLAGDMLDTLSSTRWLGPLRPWQATAAATRLQTEIAAESLRRGRRTIASLRRLARQGVFVPDATPLARPAGDRRRIVPVRIVSLAGDHDGCLPQAEQGDPALASWPPATCTRWGDDGTVLISHGHRFDPATACSASAAPRPPTVHESLAIDLVVAFVRQVRETQSFTGTRVLARALAQAEPLEIPAAIASWLRHRHIGMGSLIEVRSLWQRAVRGWQRQARRDPPAVRDQGVDLTDRLAGWLDAYVPGNPPPPAPADLMAALTPDAVSIRDVVREAGVATAVFGHFASHGVANAASSDEASILGLRERRPCLPGHNLPWAAVFEQGEHVGSRHATSAAGADDHAPGFSPAVIGGVSPSDVVDALRAA